MAALGLDTLGRSLRARGVRGEGARTALNAVARVLDALLLTRFVLAHRGNGSLYNVGVSRRSTLSCMKRSAEPSLYSAAAPAPHCFCGESGGSRDCHFSRLPRCPSATSSCGVMLSLLSFCTRGYRPVNHVDVVAEVEARCKVVVSSPSRCKPQSALHHAAPPPPPPPPTSSPGNWRRNSARKQGLS